MYSSDFMKKVLKNGRVIDAISGFCDNGDYTVIRIRYTNGVDFYVLKLNGAITDFF